MQPDPHTPPPTAAASGPRSAADAPAPAANASAAPRTAPPRWPVACRAALAMGLIALTGWASGHTSAGLIATLGAFTSLYASERPYRHRAALLAAIAATLGVAVTLGIASQPWPAVSIALVVGVAALATLASHALRIGQPGAYPFVLACAAATAIPVTGLAAWQAGLLVAGGGALCWLIHLAGALLAPRGPERAAVRAAAGALERFIARAGRDPRDQARDAAARALHQAWVTLVTWQPATHTLDTPHTTHAGPSEAAGTELATLRAATAQLHRLFAITLAAPPASDAERARRIDAARHTARLSTPAHALTDALALPLGTLTTPALLRAAAQPGSPARRHAARTALAAALAGAAGATLSLPHAYWAIAAAVLVVHQGLNWRGTLRRALDRSVGTVLGIGAAGALLALQPAGAWLAAALAALQFTVEMLVVRVYALAVVFITSIALVIASGGHALAHPLPLLLARALSRS